MMFESMIEEWFDNGNDSNENFIEAMLVGDLYAMNSYMNDIALATFSNFDAGKHVAGREESRIRPENFYHGFVLGLMVDKRDDYIIKSNKESGFGRYDVIMVPKNIENSKLPALILEFKVINSSIEKSLEETVQAALKQIK